jgi:hypothetical protein
MIVDLLDVLVSPAASQPCSGSISGSRWTFRMIAAILGRFEMQTEAKAPILQVLIGKNFGLMDF